MKLKIIITTIIITAIAAAGFIAMKYFKNQTIGIAEIPNQDFIEIGEFADNEFTAKYPNFPTYQGQVLDRVYLKTESGYQITETLNGPLNDIMSWYQSEFEKNGWTLTTSDELDSTGNIMLFTDENLVVSLTGNQVGEDIEVIIEIQG